MTSIIVEIKCPEHGLERFKVKIIKRFNIASNQIIPKFRVKPVKGELSLIYIGRSVSAKETKKYLVNYFREKGMLEKIVQMRMSL